MSQNYGHATVVPWSAQLVRDGHDANRNLHEASDRIPLKVCHEVSSHVSEPVGPPHGFASLRFPFQMLLP